MAASTEGAKRPQPPRLSEGEVLGKVEEGPQLPVHRQVISLIWINGAVTAQLCHHLDRPTKRPSLALRLPHS